MAGSYDFQGRPDLERVTRIAHEHLLHARRYPSFLKEIAERLKITEDAALAVAIADQVCEEFILTERAPG
jgi:hypothetical protein